MGKAYYSLEHTQVAWKILHKQVSKKVATLERDVEKRQRRGGFLRRSSRTAETDAKLEKLQGELQQARETLQYAENMLASNHNTGNPTKLDPKLLRDYVTCGGPKKTWSSANSVARNPFYYDAV